MFSTESSFETKLARDYLLAVGDKLEDVMPMLREQLEYYRTVAQPAIFDAHANNRNGGNGHPAWAELSPYYLASSIKKRSMHASDILQLSGAFASDLTTGTAYTVETEFVNKTDAQIAFGSSRKYPIFAGAGDGGKRQAMYITGEAGRAMTDIANHWISQQLVNKRSAAMQQNKP